MRFIGLLGYYCDVDTGMLYILSRMLSPGIARFTACDPITAGGSIAADRFCNYTYAENTPIVFVDPSGLAPAECCCCCVDSVSLVPTGKASQFEANIPNPMDANAPIPVWGNVFSHIAELKLIDGGIHGIPKSAAGGKCTIEWFECNTDSTTLAEEHGIKRNKWADTHNCTF